ncbi:hypothetical protein [Mycobacterium sp.]|uniref:hypothetical protein n=1 Tax=Mycobacterium sp. TaxID=1785 RepID=UPI002B5F2F6D|nr:hypothetical protein [Mycobacterium sp.]HKP42531.1 hypothetical protein [Mycobacterium sp.]
MAVLTTDEIDRELASREKEVASMSTTLVELDNHPGLAHVRRYPPIGITAQRWAVIETSLAQLWDDLARMTSIVESAQTLRARRSKPDDDDRAELTRLLRERALEVSRERIPLGQRQISGPGEAVEYVGLADTAERMRDTYPAVIEFLDAVDGINSLIAEQLGPSQQRLDEAGTAGPKELVELLAVSATDPLSLTTSDVETRIRIIADSIDRQSREFADLAALKANWSAALATTTSQLDALREAIQRAAQTRTHAEEAVVAGPIPVHTDAESPLREELQSITAPDPAALLSLQRRIEAALQVAREDEELAQGLLDRRSELKGRLTAYQAKAARLGLGEDPDLLASNRIAAGLLSRRPCDLRAVTRAIADYQQLIVKKRDNAT